MSVHIHLESERTRERKLPLDVLDDFQKKYPPDPVIGGETDEGARVWKVFRDEASAYDTRMLDVWNKSLDVHLLFAGLFSAVVTPFLLEVTDMLLPDTNGVVDSVGFWVNGLWLTSLFLALAAAFIAILCKQWLSEYALHVVAPSDHARQWSRRRQLNRSELKRWSLPDVIAILPGFLHLALLLFLAGLTAWLLRHNLDLTLWMIVVSGFAFLWYLVAIVTSILSDSPLTTPMLRLARTASTTAYLYGLRRIYRARLAAVRFTAFLAPAGNSGDALRQRLEQCDRDIRKSERQTDVYVKRQDALIERSERRKQFLDASALDWLISVSDRNARAVAIQAVGSLRPESHTTRSLLSAYGYLSPDEKLEIFKPERAASAGLSTLTSTEVVRISRSLLCAGLLSRTSLPQSMRQVLRGSDYPDAKLLSRWIEDSDTLSELSITGTSPSFTSTFMLLLRRDPKNALLLLSGLPSCDLQAMNADDWGIIFRSLRGYNQLGEPVEPSDSDPVPGQHALSDMLLTVAERSDDFAPVAQKIIHRYIHLTAPEPLPFQPRLVRYITSPAFLESAPEGFDSTALSRRLWLMSESMLRVHAHYLPEMLQAILSAHRVRCDVRYIIRACTNVLAFQSAGPHVNPVAMNDRTSGASTTSPDSATTPSDAVVHALLPLLEIILCESYNREDLAFWTVLHEGGNVWTLYPEEMCALAAVLASAICSIARTRKPTDPSIAGLMAAFSCGRSCLDLLRSGVLNEVDRDNVISLVRHCAELEPNFWNDESVRTRNQPVALERGNNGARSPPPLGRSSFVSDILNEVIDTLAGPCKECQGRPVGWGPVGWNNGPGEIVRNRRA